MDLKEMFFYSKSCCFIPVGWCRLNLYSKKYPSWAIGNIFIYMYIAEKDSVKLWGTDFKTFFFHEANRAL